MTLGFAWKTAPDLCIQTGVWTENFAKVSLPVQVRLLSSVCPAVSLVSALALQPTAQSEVFQWE